MGDQNQTEHNWTLRGLTRMIDEKSSRIRNDIAGPDSGSQRKVEKVGKTNRQSLCHSDPRQAQGWRMLFLPPPKIKDHSPRSQTIEL